MRVLIATLVASTLAGVATVAQAPKAPDWKQVEQESLRHFQTLVKFDTTDPPGREQDAAAYVKDVLEKEGIPVQTFALEGHRPNVVARLKGNGKKKPLLLMGHTDTVNVDPKKWTFPPFSAQRDGGYVYGRGTVDDKDNVTASLMTMLLLKRMNVPLERDVIFLAEAGEEGTTRVGIGYMVDQHFADVDAEYCLAEGGGVTREGGQVKYATIQTLEKIPRAIQLTAKGVAGHGSVPLKTNPIVHLAAAVAKIGAWRAPIRLNDTTRAYFTKLAEISSGAQAERYRGILDPKKQAEIDDWFFEHEPRHSSMLRTSISPNIIQGGYRVNVIPSEATATLDVRALPDEEVPAFLDTVRKVINDPTVTVEWSARDVRPLTELTKLQTDAMEVLEAAVKKHYEAPLVPTMSTGATDMAYLRGKGIQCYGIGPATDVEDGPKGFGAHSDQERILESELYRFVRFNWDVVVALASAR